MIKNFYAEQAVWGADKPYIIKFNSRKERDAYTTEHDYSNPISAAEVKNEYTYTPEEFEQMWENE